MTDATFAIMPVTPPAARVAVRLCRDAGGRAVYIAGRRDGFPRGTFDPGRALAFGSDREAREWFDGLSGAGRWALFRAGYRVEVESGSGTNKDELT